MSSARLNWLLKDTKASCTARKPAVTSDTVTTGKRQTSERIMPLKPECSRRLMQVQVCLSQDAWKKRKWTKTDLYSKSLFIIKNIIQAFTVYYNKWFYATVNSLYRKWRNISIFLTYVTNQEQQKEKRGRPNALEGWSVPLDPDKSPWFVLQSRLTLI